MPATNPHVPARTRVTAPRYKGRHGKSNLLPRFQGDLPDFDARCLNFGTHVPVFSQFIEGANVDDEQPVCNSQRQLRGHS